MADNKLAPPTRNALLAAYYGNPNLAAQGQRYARPNNGFLRDSQSYKDMAGNLLEMISPPVPTPEEAKAGLGSMRADRQLRGSVMQGYPDAQGLLADQAYDKMGNIAMAGMNVYHGTPHRFPPTAKNPLGEFDASKIGTGEGAQAYGHGLYFAENPGVAKTYNPNPGIAADAHRKSIKFWEKDLTSNNPAYVEKAKKEIAALNKKLANQDGALYKVDLPDEQIAKMLDWDKPLSKQSKEVQDALARATSNSSGTGKDVPRWSGVVPANYEARSHLGTTILVDPKTGMAVHPNATHPGGEADALRMVGDKGSAYLDELRVALGGEKNVAEFLRKNGIPGIRYLDQGSRAGGKGTSNFVVFDDALPKIIGRE